MVRIGAFSATPVWVAFSAATRWGLEEDRRLGDRQADEEADDDQDGRQQERDAPAPALEGGVGLEGGQQGEDTGGEQVAGGGAGLRPRGPEAPVLRLAVLGDQQHGAAPLTAEGEALDEPQGDQQQRGEDAHGAEGRQQADGERRAAHHEQRDDQELLAADPVAEVAEDQGADRAGGEADRVGAEGEQGAGELGLLGEEERREHQRRRRAVEEEVVPLDRGADDACADDLAEAGSGLRGCGHGGSPRRGVVRVRDDARSARAARPCGVLTRM